MVRGAQWQGAQWVYGRRMVDRGGARRRGWHRHVRTDTTQHRGGIGHMLGHGPVSVRRPVATVQSGVHRLVGQPVGMRVLRSRHPGQTRRGKAFEQAGSGPLARGLSAIHLQRGNEGVLRDVDLSELPHLLLPSFCFSRSFRLRVRLDCVGFDGFGKGPTDHTRCDDGVVPLICPTCQMVS